MTQRATYGRTLAPAGAARDDAAAAAHISVHLSVSGWRQGLTRVHFSAHPERFLSLTHPTRSAEVELKTTGAGGNPSMRKRLSLSEVNRERV